MTEEEKKKKAEDIEDDVDDEEVDDEEPEDEDDDIDDEDIDEIDDDEEDEDADDEDEKDKKSKEQKGSDDKKSKKVQDEAERARQAKARREREAKEQQAREKAIEEKAYLKGKLDSTKVNTFTNEPIEDEYDLKIYEIQKELDKEGKDPITDLPKRLAELNRNAGKKAKEEADSKKEREDAIDKDISDFRAKYPKVNVAELLKDPDFKDYSDGRLGIKGGKSLAQIYEDFEKFKSKYVTKKVEEEEEDDGKKSPPSPDGGRKHQKTSYSTMSEEDKIKELKRQGLI